MTTTSIVRRSSQLCFVVFSTFALTLLPFLMGCQSAKTQFAEVPSVKPQRTQPIVLTEGDSLKISFLGTPNLDTVQTIRRDGKVTLPLVGEVAAAGKTPSELAKQLTDLYAPQLTSSKDVTVTVQSSSFPVFVSGAVLRPGKVLSDRPITVLEAILESGGFDNSKANLKDIQVLRNQEGEIRHYKLNLKNVLNGTRNDVFYLKPYDIIFVPERFSWL